MLPAVLAARDKWLRPGGLLFPHRADLLVPVRLVKAGDKQARIHPALTCQGRGAGRRNQAFFELWLVSVRIPGRGVAPPVPVLGTGTGGAGIQRT